MKKAKITLLAVLSFAALLIKGSFADETTWEDIGAGKIDLRTVLVRPDNPKVIYIGLKGGIFKTENGAEEWRPVFSIRGQDNYVNLLMFDPQNKDCLFAATDNGLYYGNNQGRRWNRIFRGKNYLENRCVTLAVLYPSIYLGTKAGLFISNDCGRSWNKAEGKAGSSPAVSISHDVSDPKSVYVACAEGVFKSEDRGKSWENIFAAKALSDEEKENAEEQNEIIEERKAMRIRHLCQDKTNIYLATSEGVYKSDDRGANWQPVSNYGLLNKDVRSLFIFNDVIVYAVTKSGIFEYKNERWFEISARLTAEDIRFVDLDSGGTLYAACSNGLFRAAIDKLIVRGEPAITDMYFRDEPKICDVQKAAIEYAEVGSEKIARWRRRAAKKAFLPKLSAGVNRDTSDLWHWESGSTTKTGDDILTRGRDTTGWDLSLNWDLGEIIWNDAQTAIDVRSKLMVELRDNILDEVTKLYFERIRVKMELNNLSIEDRKRRFEKEIRLRELAASLDALTGGYFSRK